MVGVQRSPFLSCLLVLSAASWSTCGSPLSRDFSTEISTDNGGIPCIACAIVVGLAEQLSQIYNETISHAIDRLCGYLPAGVDEACKLLVDEYAPGIIKIMEQRETADVACYGVGLCKKDDSKEMCHLFPLPGNKSAAAHSARIAFAKKTAFEAKGRTYKLSSVDWCDIPVIKTICDLIDRFSDDHLPIDDIDKDYFSDLATFRGASWRGKDCNDASASVYPGRRTTDDAVLDTNCNGIVGIDPSTGQTYEGQWCNGTRPMGTVILGDSAGAHFHIPPEWVTAKELSIEAFKDLLFILENEFDWPMLSTVTGFKNSTWPVISGPVDSFYLRMRAQNRCNHRDYQSITVNGARSSSMKEKIVQSFARHGVIDQPAFMNFALLGNDVCSGHHDMDHMTTPEEFYSNNLATFRYVDSHVAPGSVLLANGLADGTVLYNSLHNRIHPIGSTNNDVTYSQFYDYMNCLEISPCFGWMNSNETWRNRTTERAMQLNQALKNLVANETFENITAHYSTLSFEDVIRYYVDKLDGKPWDLIEPVDGFHPSQIGDALFASLAWENLESTLPLLIPPVNPNNHLIENKFGDQGGY